MARTVNPERHRERREAILDAAYREFASAGFDRTTTASICRAAGISSGTFFHYFPTKLAALVGVLAAGTEATRAQLTRIAGEATGLDALLAYASELESEMADEHFGGFVRAVSGIEALPEVAALLAEDSALVEAFIRDRIGEATDAGELRADAPAGALATWVRWLIDGAAMGVAETESGSGRLGDAIRALLVPAPRA